MELPSAPPATQGVDPAGVLALLDALDGDERLEPHGLIIQRHGVRVLDAAWAPHTTDRPRLVYSLSKTFTGTALSLQLGEGRLSLDDLVSDHLELPAEADPRTRRLRIRHIASMATGHDHDTVLEALVADPEDPVRGFLRLPPEHEPGTAFAYNQPPVLALATILQQLAGEPLSAYLRPRLLDPLGVGELRWAELRPGVQLGYSGVYTDLDAVARLGQLHLDDGVWDGRRLLPEGWVAQASRPQVANPGEPNPDWQQGYGFQLWMSRHGYRGDGAFGQFMLVLPDHDAVVAVFSGNEEMQALLDHVWAHLLPAMGPSPLPAGPADGRLAERVEGLAVPTAAARHGSAALHPVTGTFVPAAHGPKGHRSATSVVADGARLTLHEGDVSFSVALAEAWTAGPTGHVSASAATTGDGRLVVDLAFLHTPHRLELVLDPADGTFRADWPAVPLFGGGLGSGLAGLVPPP